MEQLAARLATEPKDWQGWIDLARGLTGLGRPNQAAAALDQAAKVYQGAPFVLQQFATVAAELGLGAAALSALAACRISNFTAMIMPARIYPHPSANTSA